MTMLAWWKARRLRNLRERLAVVEAAIANEAEMFRITRRIYPIAMEENARELARLKFRIAEIVGNGAMPNMAD